MTPARIAEKSELGRALLPLDDAVALLEALPTHGLASEMVRVADANGRVLTNDFVAPLSLPPFDHSTMDGFAVSFANYDTANISDLPVVMRARPIATGEPLPSGTDTIIPLEHAQSQVQSSDIAISITPLKGQFIRHAGDDVQKSQVVYVAGTRLDPLALSLLSSLGCTEVSVRSRVNVAIVVSGDELVPPGNVRGERQIFDGNTTFLSAFVAGHGGLAVSCDLVGDDPDVLRRVLCAALDRSDIVVVTGGASVGTRDWTRAVLGELGECVFWKVAVKPGKPVACYRAMGKVVLALPGNPGSVFAGSYLFLRRLMGRFLGSTPTRGVLTTLLEDIPRAGDGRRQFVPLHHDAFGARPLLGHMSGSIHYLEAADSFFVAPVSGVTAGTQISVEAL